MRKNKQLWQRLLNIISCLTFSYGSSPSIRPIFRFGFLFNSLNNLPSSSQLWILSLPLSWHLPIFVHPSLGQLCLPSLRLQNNAGLTLFLILHSPNQPHLQFFCYLTAKSPGNWGSPGQNKNTSPARCEASVASRSSRLEKFILTGAMGFMNSFRKNLGWHPRF